MDATLNTIPPARFFAWCAQLAEVIVAGERSPLVAFGGDDVVERADSMLSMLAHSWGLTYGSGAVDGGEWDAALIDADAYAAAQLLARSGLTGATLARLVDRVLVAWCFGESPCSLERHAPRSERTPEVLLAALAGSPSAARRLLAEWEDEALDLLLGWDPDAVGPMLVAATSVGDDAEVGRLLGKVMRHVWDNNPDDAPASADGSRLTDWLGTVLGPWQLHLLARSPGWEWPGLDPAAVMEWVAANEQSGAALAVWWSRLTAATAA